LRRVQVDVEGTKHWLYFYSWMDNKPVHFISTFFSKFSEVSRVVKENMCYIGHQMIKIPTLAIIYNSCMGGTDSFDQLISYYKTTVKTKRWQTRVFTHFLMCAVVNAHILYKLLVGGGEEMKEGGLRRGDKGFALLDFIGILVDQLVTPMDPIPTNKKKASVDRNRFLGVHEPEYRAEKWMNDGKRECNRRACQVCSNRVKTFCVDCKVALCFSPCWKKWHTLQ
jgi:hypothetical protein